MQLVQIASFDNYIEAHVSKGRLESEDIRCWLHDEHTVTVMPAWNNAVGGIKLMVTEAQMPRAVEVLEGIEKAKRASNQCPACKSKNTEWITTPRKGMNWLSAILTYMLGNFAIAPSKVLRCFDCHREFHADDLSPDKDEVLLKEKPTAGNT